MLCDPVLNGATNFAMAAEDYPAPWPTEGVSLRILDEDTDRAIGQLLLLLTKSEAAELRDSLKNILESPDYHHEHVPSEDFEKEITIAIYSKENEDTFCARVTKLIREDQ